MRTPGELPFSADEIDPAQDKASLDSHPSNQPDGFHWHDRRKRKQVV